MAVVPVLPSPTSGVLPTSVLSAVVAAVSFLLNPPIAVIRAATTQSIPNSAWTAVSFDASDKDSVGGHSNVTNNSRYTAVYAGWYLCSGPGAFALNATGARGAAWYINGAALSYQGQLLPTLGASFGPSVAAPGQLVFLNVGDYVELRVLQNSGGALATQTGSTASIVWKSN